MGRLARRDRLSRGGLENATIAGWKTSPGGLPPVSGGSVGPGPWPETKETEMPRKVALVAVLLLGSSTLATAESGTPQEQAACRADVTRHCRGIGGDNDTILQCLVSHGPKLTAKCRSVLQEHGHLPNG
jgi:hypothetical protein